MNDNVARQTFVLMANSATQHQGKKAEAAHKKCYHEYGPRLISYEAGASLFEKRIASRSKIYKYDHPMIYGTCRLTF